MEASYRYVSEIPMSAQLPAVLERYFAAQNAHDTDALVACFAPDAVVHDEGEDIVGTAAIRAWKEKTSAKYRVTVEPLERRDESGRTVVVARVSGTFPGSPANLTYRFGLTPADQIDALQIG
jgi:hypothetical protein